MKDYIDSYISILPSDQRARIVSEIQKQTGADQSMTTSEYADFLDSISQEREIASQYNPMTDTMDSSIYNEFISNALLDMSILYDENDTLEDAINNYVKQNQAMLNEITHYMTELRAKISKLRYNDKTSSSTVSYVESFKSLDSFQVQSPNNISDYTDRDGSILKECSINTSIGYARLAEVSSSNIIMEDKPTASVVTITGTPVDEELFPVSNAIDMDIKTFWGNVILADGPIDIPVQVYFDKDSTVYRNGAIAILQIDFTRKQRINNITFKMFEEYPTVIEKIIYKTLGTPEEEFKSLTTESKTSENQTISFSFAPTNVKMIQVILRQPNYKKHEYSIFKDDEQNNELIKSLIKLDADNTLAGNFNGLTLEQINQITGVKTFQDNYASFITKYNNFKAALVAEGFNWTDAQIKEYITTGRQP